MDVSAPYRSVAPTLDIELLVALSRATQPMTVTQLRDRVGRGSDRGMRLALARLVRQGTVHEIVAGPRATLYSFNADHVAAPAVVALADLRAQFLARLRDELASWDIPPAHASLYGSAARRDGDADSDIDIFLVRPSDVPEGDERWEEQIARLADRIQAWTGNVAQINELGSDEVDDLRARRPPIVEGMRAEAIDLAGRPLRRLLTAR